MSEKDVLPPEDLPPVDWLIPGDLEKEESRLAELPHTDPLFTTFAFMAALDAEPFDLRSAQNCVDPRTMEDWGDFGTTRDLSWPAVGTSPTIPAEGVAYVRLIKDDSLTGFIVNAPTLVDADILTLLWSPTRDLWLVYRVGEPALPEDLPPGF